MGIYLDNAATSKPYKAVIDRVSETMEELYANPSSLHRLGHSAEKAIKEARNNIGEKLGLNPDNIIFTSGGTESNASVINSAFLKARGKSLLATEIEHPSVIEPLKIISQRGGRVDFIKVDRDGLVDMNDYKLKIEDAIFVSVMHVNNELGSIQPIKELSRLAQEKGVLFHVDAVQSLGKIRMDFDADFISFSGHKIHGPRGVGALYVKNPSKYLPLIYGGGQEKGYRSGTENTPGILGLSIAIDRAFDNLEERYRQVLRYKNMLAIGLMDRIKGVHLNSSAAETSPYILNMSFPGVKAEVLLHQLEKDGIYVSTGSACSSKKSGSHVLKAVGLSDDKIDSAIRLSFSAFNKEEEIETVINAFANAVERFRKLRR